MSEWIKAALVEDLPPGSRTVVEVDGVDVLIVNLGGEFLAIEDVCSHDGADISGGVIEGDEIICPRHGARFCLRSGAVKAPPAYENIAALPIRVEGKFVEVRDDRWD